MFLKPKEGGYTLAVRVLPNARRTGIAGVWNGAAVKIALSAPAVDGKANEALTAFLAEALDVRKSAITLLFGQTGRDKRLFIQGPLSPDVVSAFEGAVVSPRK